MTAKPAGRMTRVRWSGDARWARAALSGFMTGPIVFEAPQPAPVGRRARVVLAVLATLVLLACLAVVEVGTLAAVTVMSSTTNHGGGK
jgi:hypothetical protein